MRSTASLEELARNQGYPLVLSPGNLRQIIGQLSMARQIDKQVTCDKWIYTQGNFQHRR